jgi:hypothetical protein
MKTLKTLLSPLMAAVAVLVGGFVLLNLAFMVYAIVVTLPRLMAGESVEWASSALPALLWTTGAAILIGLAVRFWVDKKLRKHTILASLMTVPLMAFLVYIGITFYGVSDLAVAMVGALVIIPMLVYCLWKKVPWVYTLAVAYVGVLGVIIMVFDVQI